MNYYAIVEKDTGYMQDKITNFYPEGEVRPINEDELAVVLLNQELVDLLTLTDHNGLDLKPVDFTKSYFDFTTSTWQLVYITLDQVDTVAEKNKEKQQLLNEANAKLRIIDLPDSLKILVTTYISELSGVEVTVDTASTTVFPRIPF